MANSKISDLPAASGLAGTEQLVVVQSATSKRTTLSVITAFVSAAISAVSTSVLGHKGSIISATGAGAPTEVQPGADGTVLSPDSTLPAGVGYKTLASLGVMLKSLYTQKGGILAGTGAGNPGEAAPGADGTVVSYDSTAATGIRAKTLAALGALLQSLYTAKGVVLGATAANTPAAASGSALPQGGVLQRHNKWLPGIAWVPGLGVDSTFRLGAGPFTVTAGSTLVFDYSPGTGSPTTKTYTFPANATLSAQDVVSGSAGQDLGNIFFTVHEDGQLAIGVFYQRIPASFIRVNASSTGLAPFGLVANQMAFGSGALAAVGLSANSEAFAVTAGQTLIIQDRNSHTFTTTFQLGDTTAANIAARINATPSFVGLIAVAVGGRVQISALSGGSGVAFTIHGGTAAAAIGFTPDFWFSGDNGSYDAYLSTLGGGGGGGGTIIITLTTFESTSQTSYQTVGGMWYDPAQLPFTTALFFATGNINGAGGSFDVQLWDTANAVALGTLSFTSTSPGGNGTNITFPGGPSFVAVRVRRTAGGMGDTGTLYLGALLVGG